MMCMKNKKRKNHKKTEKLSFDKAQKGNGKFNRTINS